uniref:Uncharacterized protein n=1 Tax=Takifugu rubripes TaxID=31033 RepID=A0A674MDI1_TAKRU
MQGLCSDWVRREELLDLRTRILKDTDGTITSTLLSVARSTSLGEPGRDEGPDKFWGLKVGGLGNLRSCCFRDVRDLTCLLVKTAVLSFRMHFCTFLS